MNLDSIIKHLGKIGIIGSIILSIVLLNIRLITFKYADSFELLLFLFLIMSVGGIFMVFRKTNQPWLFIITTVSSLFNYFFIFILVSKPATIVTIAGLVAAFVWNVILDRTRGSRKLDVKS